MRWTLCKLSLFLAVSSTGLVGQAPAKTSTPSSVTNHEKNIRAYIELLRSEARKERAQIVGAVMQLDAKDAASFWPIFEDFEKEYTQFGDGALALVKSYTDNYATMTNGVADQLATKLLDLEQVRTNLKRKYYLKFKEALGAITAARFLQVESQLEKIADLLISSELPAMVGPAAGQP